MYDIDVCARSRMRCATRLPCPALRMRARLRVRPALVIVFPVGGDALLLGETVLQLPVVLVQLHQLVIVVANVVLWWVVVHAQNKNIG